MARWAFAQKHGMDGVWHMLKRRSCRRIDSHPNHAAQKYISCKAGGARTRKLRFDVDCLLFEASLVECDCKFILA